MRWLQDKQRVQQLEKENKQLRKQLEGANARIRELERELHTTAPILTNDPEVEESFYSYPSFHIFGGHGRRTPGLTNVEFSLRDAYVDADRIRSLLNSIEMPRTGRTRA